jgi:hypothetical protein
MGSRRRRRADLGIVELAVDPADVDRETYPVRIRLTRELTAYEVEGLALSAPDMRCEGSAILVPDARLDDVARDHDTWRTRLEQAQSLAEELEGEVQMADHRRVDAQTRHGSHLRSQQADDRGLH